MGAISRAAEVSGAVLSSVLGVLLLVATVLGPLQARRIRFHMSADALVQYVGGETVTLIVAVALLASAPAWWRGHLWAPAVAVGASAYVVYTFSTAWWRARSTPATLATLRRHSCSMRPSPRQVLPCS